jgi:hypothetical protein
MPEKCKQTKQAKIKIPSGDLAYFQGRVPVAAAETFPKSLVRFLLLVLLLRLLKNDRRP